MATLLNRFYYNDLFSVQKKTAYKILNAEKLHAKLKEVNRDGEEDNSYNRIQTGADGNENNIVGTGIKCWWLVQNIVLCHPLLCGCHCWDLECTLVYVLQCSFSVIRRIGVASKMCWGMATLGRLPQILIKYRILKLNEQTAFLKNHAYQQMISSWITE